MEPVDQRVPTQSVGDVVIIRTEDKNRGNWPLGIIESLIVGNDGGAKLRVAIQQLYPLELSCDRHIPASQAGMNPEAAPFRPRRDAAVAARLRVQDISQEEV